MDAKDLRTLVCIWERGSLSAAARELGMSQPSISKRVQRLEAELGVRLLLRGPKQPVELTAAGDRTLTFAREVLSRLEALERDLARLKAAEPGTLLVAASTIPGEYLLPGLLAHFRREYPQIRVQATIADSSDVVERVSAGEVDLGLIGRGLRRPGLTLERLVGDEVVLIAPPGHPLAGRGPVRVADLSGQVLVLREAGSGTRQNVESALVAAGEPLPPGLETVVLGSTQAVLQAVKQGLGIGFVSARAAAQDQADGRLACLRLAGVDLRRDLYLAYLSRRAGDAAIARFVDVARARVVG